MARKRRQKKQPKGLLYLIVLICIICFCYEPITKAFHINLPLAITEITEKVSADKPAIKDISADNLLLPASLKNVPEQILHRKGYIVSYNKDLKIPNWVAWELTREKLIERESRTNKFLPDPDLSEHEAVTTDDYKGTGLDRGHMCPAGDNRWNWKAMQESFYMTNICPQNHNLNRGDWKNWKKPAVNGQKKKGRFILFADLFFTNKNIVLSAKNIKLLFPKLFSK